MEALRQFLVAEGHEVFVLAPHYPGFRDEEAWVHRFPSFTLPAKTRFPLPLPITPAMFRRVAALGIDLFHTHHPFAMGVAALRIARRLGRPVVTTIHTQYEQYLHYIPLPAILLRPIVRQMVARYCNACQAVTTPAAGMASVVQSYGVRNAVTVVPNGVDLKRYREASGESVRQQLGLTPRHAVGLFTGRVAPEKNLPALLQATRCVVNNHPHFCLVILGDGPDLSSLRRQAVAMGLEAHVLFPGAVRHEEVPPYCAAADLFVTASTTEVNPTSVIEAMAARVPVVAYDTFGAREIVRQGEDGVLTEHRPEALASAISGLLGDRERLKRMAQSAATRAERFSLETTGREMLAVYERACAQMRSRQG